MLEEPKVALVSMPFADLAHPSIALGLLKAGLSRVQIESRVHYETLRFAAQIGTDCYAITANFDPTYMLGESVFSHLLFPTHQYDPEGVLARDSAFIPVLESIARIRALAESYIKKAADRILADNPRIVGCTSTFEQNCASLALFQEIKRRDETIITIMGGGNCEGDMAAGLVELFPYLDCAVSGEADGMVGELFHGCLQQGPEYLAGPLPQGVASRVGATLEVSGSPRPRLGRAIVQELDDLPVPDYTEYFEELKNKPFDVAPGLTVEGSRGCWWGEKLVCTFCGLNGEGIGYRSKSPERFLSEIRELSKRYGVRRFEAVDNILPRDYAKTVFQKLLDDGDDFTIFYEIKADLSHDEMELLARAGVHWIQPGIESLSQISLTRMRKGTNVLQNVQTLKWAEQFSMIVAWSVLVGFPGETAADYEEMNSVIPLIEHLQSPPGHGPRAGAQPIRFDRFGYYAKEREKLGLRLEPIAAYQWIYPFKKDEIERIAYYLELIDDDGGKLVTGEFDSPEFARFHENLTYWKNSFFGENCDTVHLAITKRDAEGVSILDTRRCRVAENHHITDLPARILDICESMKTRKEIRESLRSQYDSRVRVEEIDEAIEYLEARLLVLVRKNRVLSLPLPEKKPDKVAGFRRGIPPLGMVLKSKPKQHHPFEESILDRIFLHE